MRIFISVACTVLVLACGKGDGEEKAAGDAAKLNAEYGAFRDRLCKCTDVDCYEKVKTDTEAWLRDSTPAMESAKPTKAQEDEFDAIENDLEACAKKFEDTAAPPTPADPAQPAPPATP